MFPPDAKAECSVHNMKCRVQHRKSLGAPQPRWRIHSAGFQCTALSARGSLEGEADGTEVLFGAWLEERRALMMRGEEDILFFENSPIFPWQEKLQKELAPDGILVFGMTDGPHLHGDPIQRLRTHGFAINTRTVRWCGLDDGRWQLDFKRRSHRNNMMTRDSYLLANADRVSREKADLARVQKLTLGPEHFVSNKAVTDWGPMLFSPLHMQRIIDNLDSMQTKHSIASFGLCCFDAQQNLGWASSGPDMLCLPKVHSLFVSKAADPPDEPRLVTAMEAAQAMGFNVLDPSWTQSMLKPIFEKLQPRLLKELMGNGMHLKVEAAWMMYALANVVRVRAEDDGGLDDATISEGSLDCD